MTNGLALVQSERLTRRLDVRDQLLLLLVLLLAFGAAQKKNWRVLRNFQYRE